MKKKNTNYRQKDKNGEPLKAIDFKFKKVLAGYSNLTETEKINGQDTGKYSINIGLTPDQYKALEKNLKAEYGKKSKVILKKSIKYDDEYDDYVFIKARTKDKPHIVDDDRNQVELNGFLKRGSEITAVVSILPTLFNKDPWYTFYLGGIRLNPDDIVNYSSKSKQQAMLFDEEDEYEEADDEDTDVDDEEEDEEEEEDEDEEEEDEEEDSEVDEPLVKKKTKKKKKEEPKKKKKKKRFAVEI